MRSLDFITERASKKCIVVDVQPEYTGLGDGDELYWIDDMMNAFNIKCKLIQEFIY